MTSLLELGTLTHPVLGNGVAYRIRLPQVWDPQAAASMANTLNAWEMSGRLPAGPGAWGISREPDTLGFSGFIPNFCYAKGMATLAADWMRRKHNSTAFLINALQSEAAG
jgi:hypothetical protein